eukprot:524242-Pelagomonas_calceolata.AAC.4
MISNSFPNGISKSLDPVARLPQLQVDCDVSNKSIHGHGLSTCTLESMLIGIVLAQAVSGHQGGLA